MHPYRFIIFLLYAFPPRLVLTQNIKLAISILQDLNILWAQSANRYMIAEWNYNSNMTDETLQSFVKTSLDVAKCQKQLWSQVTQFPWQNITDPHVRRQFELFSKSIDVKILPEEKYAQLEDVLKTMKLIPEKTRIPGGPRQPAILTHLDVQEIIKKSRNPEELLYVWSEWNKAVGREVKKIYPKYVLLMNEAAKLQKFSNAEALWLSHYSDLTGIKSLAQGWWKQLEPFYKELHAYVRYKLHLKYGSIVREDGAIPAHLCGNLFGRNWRDISDIVLPYPITKNLNIEDALKEQNFTALSLMRTGDDFLLSMQMSKLPDCFWTKSIFEKPNDGRQVSSFGRTYKLYQNNDVFMSNYFTVSASSYFLSHWFATECRFERTSLQPYIFADLPKGVNLAIAETVGLSVKSFAHLRKFSLMPGKVKTFQEQINNLLYSALENIVLLPYAYIVDLWRWNVFSGKITPNNYNSAWWSLRFTYEGVESSVCTNEDQVDLGPKLHVLYGVEYFQYYLGTILSFQLHKALCSEAGLYLGRNSGKPLHECDIFGSVEAGKLLRKSLILGRSKPFLEFWEYLIGENMVNTSVILEYYEPLVKWLEEENRKNGVTPGWFKPVKTTKTLRFKLSNNQLYDVKLD